MGDPRRPRKKYQRPSHLWKADRLYPEKELKSRYGLKNMKELWVLKTELRKMRRNARSLIARIAKNDETAEQDKDKLISRLIRLGILNEGATLEDVLSLSVETLLDRRLQTMVFKKGLARTIRQARQLIVHGHIAINGKKVTRPGYIVKRGEEDLISYYKFSPFNEDKHPERMRIMGVIEEPSEEQPITEETNPEQGENVAE